MHMGHGVKPPTSCRYIPKASMPKQAKQIIARMRRGAVSKSAKTKFKIRVQSKICAPVERFALVGIHFAC